MLRRNFLLSASGLPIAAAITTRPDQVLLNGRIYTARQGTGFRQVQALAIAGGKIIASGDTAEMRALAGPATKQIDLGGKTVLPGFNDAHTHVAMAGLAHLTQVDCDLRSIADIRDAIRRRASQTPKGQWVLGFKYDDTKASEARKITLSDLDAAAPDHPVAIRHRGGHSMFYNSLALSKGDVNAKTPQPAGGEIVHDAQGSLTGELRETAKNLIPIPASPATPSDRREAVRLITKMFAKAGVTSTHDALGTPADLRAYQDAHENGELYCRVYTLIQYSYIDQMIAAGIRTGFGNEWIRTGAMKLTSDGSISERTARLSQPYEGRPIDFGIQVMPEEQLYEYARKAHVAGWQIGTHANGDEGIDVALKVYERLQREYPRKDPRFRLEHCTLVNDALLRRIRALNAIPTPFWTYVYYHGEKMAEYGAARLNRMFAMRSFLDYGIRAAPGSDYIPGPIEPMMALQSCVTRTDSRGNVWGANQRITVTECIDASTRNGAYASFEENLKGTLEPGMLADLVVLGRDPFIENPSTLVSIPVERTMAGGRWVYES